MRRREAFEILGIPEGTSQEEAKKAFKRIAAKFHPDVNKEPGAEEKFKQANEAFQAISSNDFDDNKQMPFSGGFQDFNIGNIWDIFGGFGVGQNGKSKTLVIEDIRIYQTISFKEAILGCKKEITYKCDTMCDKCSGNCYVILDNGCKTCKGTGKISSNRGNMIFSRNCTDCRGKIKTESCTNCSANGKVKSERTVSVSIKSGIANNTTLRLNGMGNFIDPSFGNSSVLITVNVEANKELWMENNDVCTNLHISLLDAIKGCTKSVNTIDGIKEINIPAISKNKNEVLMPKMGVNRLGNERVILHVDYPKDVSKLIKFLEEDK